MKNVSNRFYKKVVSLRAMHRMVHGAAIWIEMLTRQYYVYFLASKNNRVLYVGVTNDLQRRVYEHRNGLLDGFTKKYHVHKLVYYEVWEEIEGAIGREKQIKAGSRVKKNELIRGANPRWDDLWGQIIS